jgi:OHCU decarboxylase
VTLGSLNALDAAAASRAFLRCCGSSRWARRMIQARPFASVEAMASTADAVWWALDRTDWLEAFAAHPEIGAGAAGRSGGSGASSWSDEEQAGVAVAAEQTQRRLAEAVRDYRTRYGHIFIVCAAGKTGDEMLALIEGRLRHDPDDELRIAAEEQRKITQLRLTKLLEEDTR